MLASLNPMFLSSMRLAEALQLAEKKSRAPIHHRDYQHTLFARFENFLAQASLAETSRCAVRTSTRELCSAGIPRVQGQDYDSAKHAFDGKVIHLSVMRLVFRTMDLKTTTGQFL
jgi:hypothetical protein